MGYYKTSTTMEIKVSPTIRQRRTMQRPLNTVIEIATDDEGMVLGIPKLNKIVRVKEITQGPAADPNNKLCKEFLQNITYDQTKIRCNKVVQ